MVIHLYFKSSPYWLVRRSTNSGFLLACVCVSIWMYGVYINTHMRVRVREYALTCSPCVKMCKTYTNWSANVLLISCMVCVCVRVLAFVAHMHTHIPSVSVIHTYDIVHILNELTLQCVLYLAIHDSLLKICLWKPKTKHESIGRVLFDCFFFTQWNVVLRERDYNSLLSV